MNDGFYDITCPLKVLRKECIADITFYNTFHRFVPFLVKMQGYKVKEVAISHYPRVAGESKYGMWNRLWVGIKSMYAVNWMARNYRNYTIKNKK